MTDEELATIRAEYDAANGDVELRDWMIVGERVPALLAEVDRLRAELAAQGIAK